MDMRIADKLAELRADVEYAVEQFVAEPKLTNKELVQSAMERMLGFAIMLENALETA